MKSLSSTLSVASFFARLALGIGLGLAVGGCAVEASEAAHGDEVVAESEDGLASAPSNYGYFIVTHHDLRKCMAPLCGGFFVKRVNEQNTRCADGSLQAECYISSIELQSINLSPREEQDFRAAFESGQGLIKARTYKTKWNTVTLGKLKASEAWLGATGSTPDGTFYRAADNGVRCIQAPCPSTTAYGLNGVEDHPVVEVRLERTAKLADASELARAADALGGQEGILFAGGILLPKCLPSAHCGPLAFASEFFLRVTPREGKACGARGVQFCNNGQYCAFSPAAICGAADAPGACRYLPEVCPQVFAPVCGCDGKTHGNACEAAVAGTSVASQGACK